MGLDLCGETFTFKSTSGVVERSMAFGFLGVSGSFLSVSWLIKKAVGESGCEEGENDTVTRHGRSISSRCRE